MMSCARGSHSSSLAVSADIQQGRHRHYHRPVPLFNPRSPIIILHQMNSDPISKTIAEAIINLHSLIIRVLKEALLKQAFRVFSGD